MMTLYLYKLWNGKKQIGVFSTYTQLEGERLVLPVFSILKEPYARSKQRKDIEFPLEWINTLNSPSLKVFELVIVVKGKSKKQKDALIKAGASFYATGETL